MVENEAIRIAKGRFSTLKDTRKISLTPTNVDFLKREFKFKSWLGAKFQAGYEARCA